MIAPKGAADQWDIRHDGRSANAAITQKPEAADQLRAKTGVSCWYAGFCSQFIFIFLPLIGRSFDQKSPAEMESVVRLPSATV